MVEVFAPCEVRGRGIGRERRGAVRGLAREGKATLRTVSPEPVLLGVGPGEPGPGFRELRIQIHRMLQQVLRITEVGNLDAPRQQHLSPEIEVVGRGVRRGPYRKPGLLGCGDRRAHLPRHALGDLALDPEVVGGRVRLKRLTPHRRLGPGTKQFRAHPKVVSRGPPSLPIRSARM